MDKRLEMQGNDVYVVFGVDRDNRLRKWLINELGEWGYGLEGFYLWDDVTNPKPAYKVRDNYAALRMVVEAVTKINNWQKGEARYAREHGRTLTVELYEIQPQVYERLNELRIPVLLKDEMEKAEMAAGRAREAARRAVALEEEQPRQERELQVVWNGLTRGEMREMMRKGTLIETCQTKTYYEMYADGIF